MTLTIRHTLTALFLLMCCAAPQAGMEVKWKNVQDLQLGSALFNLYQDKNLSGIIQLSAALDLDKVKMQRSEAQLALAMLNLSYGLHRETAVTMLELLKQGNVNEDISNHIWFYIAKIRYQRGYFSMAESALSQITGALPWELEQDLKLFMALLLMDRQQYQSAIKVLGQMQGKTSAVPFARYNAGAGLVIEETDKERGIQLIRTVANMTPRNKQEKFLKDRANSRLGFVELIDNEDPIAAIRYFEQVHLHGPESDEALLGLGWAHYTQDNHNAALVAWSELAGRNVANKNVQEALMAVPYTLAKLESYDQAAEKYNYALAAFNGEQESIQRTINSVKKGAFFDKLLSNVSEGEKGWKGDVYALPNTSESYYFMQMLASHNYQEALKNYRDLRYLLEKLDQWEADLATFDNTNNYWANNLRQQAKQFNQRQFMQHLEQLRTTRADYIGRLEQLDGSQDAMALASSEELKRLQRILQLKAIAELRSAREPNIESYRRKLQLLEQRVLWDIYSQFPARHRKLRLELDEIDTLINQVEQNKQQLQITVNQTAGDAMKYQLRIATANQRIQSQRQKIKAAITATEAHLTTIALQDLQMRQELLAEFIAQISFSVGAAYDRGQ